MGRAKGEARGGDGAVRCWRASDTRTRECSAFSALKGSAGRPDGVGEDGGGRFVRGMAWAAASSTLASQEERRLPAGCQRALHDVRAYRITQTDENVRASREWR